jgi:hypothetical protein
VEFAPQAIADDIFVLDFSYSKIMKKKMKKKMRIQLLQKWRQIQMQLMQNLLENGHRDYFPFYF